MSATLIGAKTYETTWNIMGYGKLIGRICLPLLRQGVRLASLIRDYEDVYGHADFFTQTHWSFSKFKPEMDIVAVKYGYAKSTPENMAVLLSQSKRLAKRLKFTLYLEAVEQDLNLFGAPDAYVQYVNVYAECGRSEASIIHPSFANHEAQIARSEALRAKHPVVIPKTAIAAPTLDSLDLEKLKADVVHSVPVAPAPVAPVVPARKVKLSVATDEPVYKSGGKREVGFVEASCGCSVPDIPENVKAGLLDEELFSVLCHMPRVGLLYRDHLVGNGADYVNRPVESTVDRDWLKGR